MTGFRKEIVILLLLMLLKIMFSKQVNYCFFFQVALQLLDYHYADEKVRSLAVKRLSKLTNDELLVYFLQLIQVSGCGLSGRDKLKTHPLLQFGINLCDQFLYKILITVQKVHCCIYNIIIVLCILYTLCVFRYMYSESLFKLIIYFRY